MRARHLLPLALLALGACRMGPNYERPAVPAPVTFRDSSARDTTRRDTTYADLPWWRVFRDSTLQQLIRTALAQNLDLQVAAERVLQAEAQLGITRADLYPQVGAAASGERRRYEASQSTLLGLGVSAFWEVDLFGRVRRASDRDRALLLATEEARHGVVLALVSSVAAGYANLRTLDFQLDVARRTAESRRQYVAIARQRFEGGVTGEIDYRQAQAQYEDARTLVVNLREAIDVQENALSTLLGHAPGAIPRGRPIDNAPLPPPVPVGLPSSLLERRPDLRQAEQQLAALTYNVGVAKAALWPNLSLTGAFGFASAELGSLFTGSSTVWTLGAGVLQPIFQGGRLRGNVRVTEAQMREGILAYRGAILRALEETENALVALRLASDRTASLDSQVTYNRIVLRLAETRYEGGVAPYLEVLDAQRQLLSTELAAADARRRHLFGYIDLYRALGGGWQTDSTTQGAR
jgi:multidrug efflux system outer membrane protein